MARLRRNSAFDGLRDLIRSLPARSARSDNDVGREDKVGVGSPEPPEAIEVNRPYQIFTRLSAERTIGEPSEMPNAF